MKPAIVLLSGGVDSTTALAVARSRDFEIYAISFDYCQRHDIELTFAKKGAELFSVKKHLIIRFDLREIGGSALTSGIEVPKDRKALSVMSNELKNPSRITHHASRITAVPVTYVPARNTIFLSFALAFAESIGAEDIFIGANSVDYSGYPDCRPEFISAFEKLANLATKAGVEGTARFKIHAPLINLTKAEIIKKGLELGVDYSKTWSCYDPQLKQVESSKLKVQSYRKENPKLNSSLPGLVQRSGAGVTRHSSLIPCGRCDSCLLRAKGFKEAGIEDPLLVKVKH